MEMDRFALRKFLRQFAILPTSKQRRVLAVLSRCMTLGASGGIEACRLVNPPIPLYQFHSRQIHQDRPTPPRSSLTLCALGEQGDDSGHRQASRAHNLAMLLREFPEAKKDLVRQDLLRLASLDRLFAS
jgi:hypothetical protein